MLDAKKPLIMSGFPCVLVEVLLAYFFMLAS